MQSQKTSEEQHRGDGQALERRNRTGGHPDLTTLMNSSASPFRAASRAPRAASHQLRPAERKCPLTSFLGAFARQAAAAESRMSTMTLVHREQQTRWAQCPGDHELAACCSTPLAGARSVRRLQVPSSIPTVGGRHVQLQQPPTQRGSGRPPALPTPRNQPVGQQAAPRARSAPGTNHLAGHGAGAKDAALPRSPRYHAGRRSRADTCRGHRPPIG